MCTSGKVDSPPFLLQKEQNQIESINMGAKGRKLFATLVLCTGVNDNMTAYNLPAYNRGTEKLTQKDRLEEHVIFHSSGLYHSFFLASISIFFFLALPKHFFFFFLVSCLDFSSVFCVCNLLLQLKKT